MEPPIVDYTGRSTTKRCLLENTGPDAAYVVFGRTVFTGSTGKYSSIVNKLLLEKAETRPRSSGYYFGSGLKAETHLPLKQGNAERLVSAYMNYEYIFKWNNIYK